MFGNGPKAHFLPRREQQTTEEHENEWAPGLNDMGLSSKNNWSSQAHNAYFEERSCTC